jgi:hypothetical protein
MARIAEVIDGPSPDDQRFELGDLLTQRMFDPQVQGHVRAGTSGAHPGQPHFGRIARHIEQLDIAAIGLHERTNPIEHRVDALSGHHADHKGNGDARKATAETRQSRGFPKDFVDSDADYFAARA